MADLWDELATTLTRQGKTASPGTGSSTTVPLPLHLGAATARHRLHGALRVWVKQLVTDARAAGVTVTVVAWSPAALASVLTSHLAWVAGRDWFPDMAAAIRAEVDAATRVIDRPPTMLTLGACTSDGCGAELRAPDHATTTTCRECGAVWDVAEVRDWLKAEAQEPDARMVTQTQATRIIPVGLTQLNNWVHRGLITPARVEGRTKWLDVTHVARLYTLSKQGRRLTHIDTERTLS